MNQSAISISTNLPQTTFGIPIKYPSSTLSIPMSLRPPSNNNDLSNVRRPNLLEPQPTSFTQSNPSGTPKSLHVVSPHVENTKIMLTSFTRDDQSAADSEFGDFSIKHRSQKVMDVKRDPVSPASSRMKQWPLISQEIYTLQPITERSETPGNYSSGISECHSPDPSHRELPKPDKPQAEEGKPNEDVMSTPTFTAVTSTPNFRGLSDRLPPQSYPLRSLNCQKPLNVNIDQSNSAAPKVPLKGANGPIVVPGGFNFFSTSNTFQSGKAFDESGEDDLQEKPSLVAKMMVGRYRSADVVHSSNTTKSAGIKPPSNFSSSYIHSKVFASGNEELTQKIIDESMFFKKNRKNDDDNVTNSSSSQQGLQPARSASRVLIFGNEDDDKPKGSFAEIASAKVKSKSKNLFADEGEEEQRLACKHSRSQASHPLLESECFEIDNQYDDLPMKKQKSQFFAKGAKTATRTNSSEFCLEDTPSYSIDSRFLQDYEFIEILGDKSLGTVFKCKNRLDKQPYVIKCVESKLKNQEELRRTLNEIQAFNSSMNVEFNHFIVKYYNSWIEEDKLYIVMEYCPSNLNHLKCGDVKEETIKTVMRDICIGLRDMHKSKLVHLHIKPENILLSKTQKYKIADLGLSKTMYQLRLENNEATRKEIEEDKSYLAPEVLTENGPSTDLTKSDIFSLGVTIYEILLGIDFRNNPEAQADIQNSNFNKLEALEDCKYSQELKDTIKAMLNVNAERRPTAEELLNGYLLTDAEKAAQKEKGRNGELRQEITELKTKLGIKRKKSL